MPKTKYCKRGNHDLPLDKFFKHKQFPDGLYPTCKDCEYQRRKDKSGSLVRTEKVCSNKTCTHKGKVQPIDNFYKSIRESDGHEPLCKDCQQDQKNKWAEQNKEEVRAYNKQYQHDNAEQLNTTQRKRRKENPEPYRQYGRKDYKRHSKQRISHVQNDPVLRLKKNLRDRTGAALKARSWRKTTHFVEYIGCTLEELVHHLEKQFIEGMTWSNYGRDGWVIDHIIPLATANNAEETYKLCHYTNLQPLWAIDNSRKHSKLDFKIDRDVQDK